MQVEIEAKGHRFTVALTNVKEDGTLANDAKAYTARAEIRRDGKILGSGRWDGEGLVDSPMLMSSCDDTQDIYSALDSEIRATLRQHGGAR